MPSINVVVNPSELLEFAENNNIAGWNDACEMLYPLYPQDGAGSSFIDPKEYAYNKDYPKYYDEKLDKIINGFAKLHDKEFGTLGGFDLVPD